MAGLFKHLVMDDGKFNISLIDNILDAYEVLEECFGLIKEARELIHISFTHDVEAYDYLKKADKWLEKTGGL